MFYSIIRCWINGTPPRLTSPADSERGNEHRVIRGIGLTHAACTSIVKLGSSGLLIIAWMKSDGDGL